LPVRENATTTYSSGSSPKTGVDIKKLIYVFKYLSIVPYEGTLTVYFLIGLFSRGSSDTYFLSIYNRFISE